MVATAVVNKPIDLGEFNRIKASLTAELDETRLDLEDIDPDKIDELADDRDFTIGNIPREHVADKLRSKLKRGSTLSRKELDMLDELDLDDVDDLKSLNRKNDDGFSFTASPFKILMRALTD